jgi:hypothetical protein
MLAKVSSFPAFIIKKRQEIYAAQPISFWRAVSAFRTSFDQAVLLLKSSDAQITTKAGTLRGISRGRADSNRLGKLPSGFTFAAIRHPPSFEGPK